LNIAQLSAAQVVGPESTTVSNLTSTQVATLTAAQIGGLQVGGLRHFVYDRAFRIDVIASGRADQHSDCRTDDRPIQCAHEHDEHSSA
jgi:hypothetical protein